MPFSGWRSFSFLRSLEKRSRSSARSMASGVVPRMGTPAFFERAGELQRRLAAELHDDALERAVRLLGVDDLQHVFGGERLEIEAVGGVVVGRHGFRVAVDHDRFIARVMQREAGMAAAIVELDALADAVGPAAEDDDLLRGPRACASSSGVIGRIHVGGGRGEFGRTGVDALEDGAHAQLVAMGCAPCLR